MAPDDTGSTNRRRLLYVIQGHPTGASRSYAPAVGGAQIQAQRVAELLTSEWDLCVLTECPPGGPYEETLGEVRIYRVPLSERGGTRGAIAILLRLIYSGLHLPRPDIAQGFQLNALTLAAATVATLRRSPYVIKITGRGNLERLRGLRGRMQLRLLAGAASAIVAPSQSCAEAARDAGVEGGKIHYIPNGVDTDYFHPPDPHQRATVRATLGYNPEDFVFCWIGRLHPLKGLDCIPNAWPLVAAQCPNARLLIVGDGEDENIAQGLASTFPHSVQRLHFHSDVRPFYHCADAVLLTSRSEGLSNVLLEGMACGLPGVVSSARENAEVAAGNDFILTFDRESPESIVAALTLAVRRQNREVELGRAARRHVELQYSLSHTAARWNDLYHHLLRSP